MADCDVPECYVALIQAGRYDGLAGLFAEDAEFQNPLGDVLRGRAAIDRMEINDDDHLLPCPDPARSAVRDVPALRAVHRTRRGGGHCGFGVGFDSVRLS